LQLQFFFLFLFFSHQAAILDSRTLFKTP